MEEIYDSKIRKRDNLTELEEKEEDKKENSNNILTEMEAKDPNINSYDFYGSYNDENIDKTNSIYENSISKIEKKNDLNDSLIYFGFNSQEVEIIDKLFDDFKKND